MEGATEVKHSGMEPEIHLFVPQAESSDSVIPLRWCLCPDLIKRLKDMGAINPQLLIVITDESGNESDRKLLPIEQMMEYFAFRRSGRHLIFANIVWQEEGNKKLLRKIFLGKNVRGNYENYYLVEKEEAAPHFILNRVYSEFQKAGPREAILEVNVGEEFFAKPHAEWLNKWVGYWHERSPVDQRQFRRWAIMAFTIQPPAMLIWTIGLFIVRLVIAITLLGWGMREINLSPVVRLFSRDTDDIWGRNQYHHAKSVFTVNAEGLERPVFVKAMTPLIFLSFFAIGGIIKAICVATNTTCPSLLWFMAGSVAVQLLFIAACSYLYLLDLLLSKIWLSGSKRRKEAVEGAKKEKQRLRLERARAKCDAIYQPLACPGVPLKPDLDDLPEPFI